MSINMKHRHLICDFIAWQTIESEVERDIYIYKDKKREVGRERESVDACVRACVCRGSV